VAPKFGEFRKPPCAEFPRQPNEDASGENQNLERSVDLHAQNIQGNLTRILREEKKTSSADLHAPLWASVGLCGFPWASVGLCGPLLASVGLCGLGWVWGERLWGGRHKAAKALCVAGPAWGTTGRFEPGHTPHLRDY
jgi:hypothetical protein